MWPKLFKRFCFSLAGAVLLASISLLWFSFQYPHEAAAQETPSCAGCHPQIQNAWLEGLHGRSNTDPTFKNAWEAQGKPGACLVCHVTGYDPQTATWREDGVSCEACHSPLPADHALDPAAHPVPVDRTSNLCGRCHSDTRFAWDQWQISAHYQRGMTCSVCHDPHTADLKLLTDENGKSNVSLLCMNCHRDYSMTISYSSHAQAGVTCVDCHLRHYGQEVTAEIHTVPDHSFAASITSCNDCHAEQMHSAAEADASLSTQDPLSEPPLPTPEISDTPATVSPTGFAFLAGLLGLAGGMVLSPWLERWYCYLNKDRSVKKDEQETSHSS